MTHTIIKRNINRLLKEKNCKVSEIEKKIGSSRSVTSILKDKSKTPTIEVLQAIANAFNVNIEEIINEPVLIGGANTKLLLNVCNEVIKEIESLNSPNLGYLNTLSIIKEVYEYSIHLNLEKVDLNFVKWTVSKYTRSE